MRHEEWLSEFDDAGAIWRYLDRSPYHASFEQADVHSDFYLNTDSIIYDRHCGAKVVAALTGLIGNDFPPEATLLTYKDKLCSSLALGAKISQAMGIGLLAYSLEDDKFTPDEAIENKTLIVVADDIHSGASLQKTIVAARKNRARIHGKIYCIGNFSELLELNGMTLRSLIVMPIRKWQRSACPLCKNGSLPIAARSNWQKLRNDLS